MEKIFSVTKLTFSHMTMIFMELDITLLAPGKIISVSKTTFSCAKKIVTFASKIISGVENIVLLTELIVAATQMIGSKSLRIADATE